MYSKVLFALFNFIVVLSEICAQDFEECVKIEWALECCKIPNVPKDLDNMMAQIVGDPKKLEAKFEGCVNTMKDELKAAKPEKALKSLECLAECVLNDTEIMTSDFKFNQDVAFKLLENDPEYKAFAKKHMDICDEKTTNLSGSGKCKGNFAFFSACLIEEVANNCPKEGPLAGRPECQHKDLSMSKCNPLALLTKMP